MMMITVDKMMKNVKLSLIAAIALAGGLSSCLKKTAIDCEKPYYVKRIEIQVSPPKQVYAVNDTIWFQGEWNTVSKPDQTPLPGYDYVDKVLDFRNTFTGIDIAPLQLREVENTNDLGYNGFFAGQSFTFIAAAGGMQNASLINQTSDILGKYLQFDRNAEVIKFRFGIIPRFPGKFAIYMNNSNINRCDAPTNIPHLLQLLPEMPLAGPNNLLFRTLKINEVGLRVEPGGGVNSFGIQDPETEFTILAFTVN
jgi:hypothetical protein